MYICISEYTIKTTSGKMFNLQTIKLSISFKDYLFI